MNNPLLIGLSGKRGSGKGFACEALQAFYAKTGRTVTVFKFSDVLGEILDDRNIEKTQENYNKLFIETNSRKPGFMTVILEQKILENSDVLICDGVRDADQAEVIRRHKGYIIYIESDEQKRYLKVVERMEKSGDAEISQEEFMTDEENAANNNIEGLRKIANTVLINDYTKQFVSKIESVASNMNKFLY